MTFPNLAGDHDTTDDILTAELNAAGIPTLEQTEGPLSDIVRKFIRDQSGEVKTSVIGYLHGWEFKRAWYYWVAKGPGIEITDAEELQKKFGTVVRANGDAGCRGPRFWFKGLACGMYHVDTPEGLKALADTIKHIVERCAVIEK